MKTIKLRLTDELKWLEKVHPSARARLIKYALSKLSRDEILQFLFESDGKEDKTIHVDKQEKAVKEFESW